MAACEILATPFQGGVASHFTQRQPRTLRSFLSHYLSPSLTSFFWNMFEEGGLPLPMRSDGQSGLGYAPYNFYIFSRGFPHRLERRRPRPYLSEPLEIFPSREHSPSFRVYVNKSFCLVDRRRPRYSRWPPLSVADVAHVPLFCLRSRHLRLTLFLEIPVGEIPSLKVSHDLSYFTLFHDFKRNTCIRL